MAMKTTRGVRSPVRWFGGKGLMVGKILPLFPEHHTYVEVFGGGASLLFAKEPAPVEVYNDLDGGLVNFFRVLRDPGKFPRLLHLASLTPYSREEYAHFRATWQTCDDDVDRAHRWFVVSRMNFSGDWSSASWSKTVIQVKRGMAESVSKYLSTIEALPEFHARLMPVQIEHRDFRQIIPAYDTPNTLFYCDPPYIHDTRTDHTGMYRHELSLFDHWELVQVLLRIKGKAILSGYAHKEYKALEEAGWTRKDFNVGCAAAARTKATGILGAGAARSKAARVESVWISPILHSELRTPNSEGELP